MQIFTKKVISAANKNREIMGTYTLEIDSGLGHFTDFRFTLDFPINIGGFDIARY